MSFLPANQDEQQILTDNDNPRILKTRFLPTNQDENQNLSGINYFKKHFPKPSLTDNVPDSHRFLVGCPKHNVQ